MHWSELWRKFLNGDTAAVTALGTLATVVVAIVAAAMVVYQVWAARKLNVEAAQPNVVMFMESNVNQPQMVEMVVKNFGSTPAHDVLITMDVTPRRIFGGTIADVWFPSVISFLAPGQEWRTTWDFAPRRMDSELKSEDRHEVKLVFRGIGREKRDSTSTLDWSQFKGRRFLEQRSIHHGVKALETIQKTLSTWSESGKALSVLVRDGDAIDEEERLETQEYFAERERAREAAAANNPQGPSGSFSTPFELGFAAADE